MPIFRSIEISVIAGSEAQKLPEYPHPEGASVRLVAASDISKGSPLGPRQQSESSMLSELDPTRQRKVNPRVSVYIPSMPGEQFWLKYHVIRPPIPSTHLFFKMIMNGRLITSWGVPMSRDQSDDSHRFIGGTVMRALYEPGARYQDDTAEMDWNAIGIEARYFYFMRGLEKQTVAEDGGLIEVQVFRSKGRKRRAPKMSEFRNQERYGITIPSGGLLDHPQDATYYDWLLIDPKDAPYATFCFHYRSMSWLLQLSLVPHPESCTRSARFETDCSTNLETQSPDEDTSASPLSITSRSPHNVASDHNYDEIGRARTHERSCLRSQSALLPAKRQDRNTVQPSKAAPDAFDLGLLRRPLPEPPNAVSRQSSSTSLRSTCPSLTPSLAYYVDSGDFGDDEVSINMAHTGIASSASLVQLAQQRLETGDGDEYSCSDYENSPPSTAASLSPESPLPKISMSTTGSVLERHIAQLNSPIQHRSLQRPLARIPVSASETMLSHIPDASDSRTLNLSESEWMRKTPSPIRQSSQRSINRLWSPRLGKKVIALGSRESIRNNRSSALRLQLSQPAVTKGTHDESNPQNQLGYPATSYDDGIKTTPALGHRHCSGQQDLQDHSAPNRDINNNASDGHNFWESCRELSHP